MKINFTANAEKGLSQEQIDLAINTLNYLTKQYPGVVIDKFGDFYTRDYYIHMSAFLTLYNQYGKLEAEEKLKAGKIHDVTFEHNVVLEEYKKLRDEEDKFYLYGEYRADDRTIYINHAVWKDKITYDKYIENRKEKIKIIEMRKKTCPETLKHLKVWFDFGDTLEGLIRHEFGHALGYQYSIDEDQEMIKLHSSLSSDEIRIELSEHATDGIHEFIAVGFTESFFEDARPLGIKIRSIIDRIVANSKPMSQSEKFAKLIMKQIAGE